MLGKIREKTQGIIATFIIALIAIPFALWGINSYFESGSKITVATVGDIEISQATFRSALDRVRGQVEPAMLESKDFKRLVLEGLIEQALLVHDAEEAGYRLSDAELARRIRQLPVFQRDGRFDPQLYEALLRREGIGTYEFENRLRAESLTGQIQAGLVESAFLVDSQLQVLLRMLQQERDISYAVVKPDRFVAGVEVAASAIEEYYNTHPEQFSEPEKVRAAYVRLSAPDLVREYRPSDDEIQRAYEEEAARYTTPARRRVSHILVQVARDATGDAVGRAERKIADIQQRLQKGEDFAKLAREHSEDPDSAAKGGDLGEISPGLLPGELESAATKLSLNEVSKPIRSAYGFHLLKLTVYTPEKRRPLAEVRNELVKLVAKRKGEERFYELAEKFRNAVYEQSDSLEPAAKLLGIKVQQSDWFTRSGGDGIAADPKVVEAAFAPEVVAQSRNSDALEVSADTLVAVRVIGHKPAARKPLADVRSRIERSLRQERARERAEALAEELRTELRKGAITLEQAAKSHDLNLEKRRTVTRARAQRIDPRLLEALFRAPRPEAGKRVHDLARIGDEGYAVFTLWQVRDGDPEKADATTRERARQLLLARNGSGFYANYRAGLRQMAEVKVYDDRL